MRLARIILARGLLWLARLIDRSPVLSLKSQGKPADRPPTLRELALVLARVKLGRWRRALRRIAL